MVAILAFLWIRGTTLKDDREKTWPIYRCRSHSHDDWIDCSTPPFVWVSEIRLIFEDDFVHVLGYPPMFAV
jgi:hypothetical protein